MAINIFEGARRIAKLVAVFIVIGFGVAIVSTRSTTVWVYYAILDPSAVPLMASQCGPSAATESKYLTSKRGVSVHATLCFEPMEFQAPSQTLSEHPAAKYQAPQETRQLIPYRIDKATGEIWGNGQYSDNVTNYTKRVINTFAIPESDEERISDLRWSKMIEDAGSYLLGMLASLVVLWGFTWTVGWIVRGFLGIPRGSDLRP